MTTTSSYTLSPYKIFWVEVRANKGIVTKHDKALMGDLMINPNRATKYYLHFPSRDKALAWIKRDWSKLDKQYECRLCTDKQYGLMVDGVIPFTAKQNNEVYYIG